MRTQFPIVYSLLNKFRRDLYLAAFRRNRSSVDAKNLFTYYYERNLFGDPESYSGTGSSLKATETIRSILPSLLDELCVMTVLDLPCGDFNWAKEIDWGPYGYIGADIVAPLIERNRQLYGSDSCRFEVVDILVDPLPRCDMLLCRDLFIHFPNELVAKSLSRIKSSGARFLLTSHFPRIKTNTDIKLGSFRPMNLEKAPFNLPPPERTIADNDYLKLWGRTLALWPVDSLS